jgi:hypothetical protein
MITTTSFKAIIAAQRRHPTEWLWRQCLSIRSQFCEAVVAAGYLSWEQMVSAACRYRLGASRLGGVIFWQIDQEERVHDGKVMYYQPDCHRDKGRNPTWVSALLRRRNPFPDSPHETSHCFFGAHLISPLNERLFRPPLTPPRSSFARLLPKGRKNSGGETAIAVMEGQGGRSSIAVVEAEKTAVILSELYPQYVWLAAGGLGEVQVDKFRPLRGHKVIMFPDTDPEGVAYKRWCEAAERVMGQPFWEDSLPIRVSNVLERHASPEQKARKIDLVDFLFDRRTDEKT